jgi:hypothetical protein
LERGCGRDDDGAFAATFGRKDVILFLGLQSCGPAVAERPCVRAGCRLKGNAAYAILLLRNP